jgi:replicative DNA helicase
VKPDYQGMDVAEAAEELSERLRVFAHRTRTLTVVLSQLNRGASRERDRQPTMHDLWGGTSMESNANQVVLLDHSRSQKDREDPALLRTYILLDKNREGPAKVQIPVEIDFRRGHWRQGLPDEVDRWWPGV